MLRDIVPIFRLLRRSTAGSGFVQWIILVGCVALAGVGAYAAFGKELQKKAQSQAQHVRDLSGTDPGASGPICTGGTCTGGSMCFAAGTPVATPTGPTPIERINAGDEVLSYREETGAFVASRVIATFKTPDRDVLEVHVRGDSSPLRVTPGHPFMTLDRGWVRADTIEPGEPLVDASDSAVPVESVVRISARETVYNFEVDETHTYFVGAARVLVHNTGRSRPSIRDFVRRFSFRRGSGQQQPGGSSFNPLPSPAPTPPLTVLQQLMNNPIQTLNTYPISVDSVPPNPDGGPVNVALTTMGGNQPIYFVTAVPAMDPNAPFQAWFVPTYGQVSWNGTLRPTALPQDGPPIAITWNQSGCTVAMGNCGLDGTPMAGHLYATAPVAGCPGGADCQTPGGHSYHIAQYVPAAGFDIQGVGNNSPSIVVGPGNGYNEGNLNERMQVIWLRNPDGSWTAYGQRRPRDAPAGTPQILGVQTLGTLPPPNRLQSVPEEDEPDPGRSSQNGSGGQCG